MRKQTIIYIVPLLFLAACGSKEEGKAEGAKAAKTKYTIATVKEGGVSSTMKLPGQLVAYEEVSIFPKVNGYVKGVYVDIGSKVVKGTLLMTLDAPELMQATTQAKERYLRSKGDFLIDKERYSRLLEASQTEGAVSAMDLSAIRAKMGADSAISNAEKANWEMQQTMLGYTNVTAAFSGVITEKNVSPGALVSAAAKDRPMLELKEVDRLRLRVDIPESVASTLHEGDELLFSLSSRNGEQMKGRISRKSSSINSQFRAERIEVDVKNDKGVLAPGMYADVIIHSGGDVRAMYVPKSAVVTSTERKYILVVRDGKTTKVDVSTGNSDAALTEVFGLLHSGERIVADANEEMKEGEVVE